MYVLSTILLHRRSNRLLIKDSPSNTFEHHRHFHLPMFHSNTLNTSYHINLFIKCNNTRLAGLEKCRGQTGRQTLIFTLCLRIDESCDHSSIGFPIIFILIYIFVLPNFLVVAFHLMNEVHHSFTTNFSFPKITAKSASDDDIIISDIILDQVHLDYLKETIYDLSSFHTRHTESENIDDVASWLLEKLQNICGGDVYIHNFTHTPDVIHSLISYSYAE